MNNKELMLDVGQANDLKLAMRKGGWTNDDLKHLENQSILSNVLLFVRGQAEVKPKRKHNWIMVDFDAPPHCPEKWSVDGHLTSLGQQKVELRSDDNLYVGGRKVEDWLSERQMNGRSVKGTELEKEWEAQEVLNDNLLDALYNNQHLIPEHWKDGKFRYFPGTKFHFPDGYLYIRYLYWFDGQWHWDWLWLGNLWDGADPTAVLASPL